MSKPDDLFIAVLKYGKQHLHEWVTSEDVKNHLKERGFDFEDKVIEILFEDALGQTFAFFKKKGEDLKYRMNMDSYFQLLEYEELHDARDSAAVAKKLALFAIMVSIAAMFISGYMSYKQMNAPLSIEGKQFARIDAIGAELKLVNEKLEEFSDMKDPLRLTLPPTPSE